MALAVPLSRFASRVCGGSAFFVRCNAAMSAIRDCLRAEWLYRLSVYLCAVVPLFFGVMWTYTFGFTSYRSHLRMFGIPLGLVCIALALGMLALRRWAIFISAALSVCAAMFALVILCTGAHWFYGVVLLLGFAYTFIVFERFSDRAV